MKYIKKYENLNNIKNRNIIKNYIKRSSSSYVKRFFTVLHNYLLLSEIFTNIFSKYKLTTYLELEDIENKDEIYKIFNEMYDPVSPVRNCLEKISDIDEFKHIADNDFYNKILTKNDIYMKDKLYKFNL